MQRPSGSCTSLTCSSNERTRGCSMHTLISSATFLSRSQASSSGRISSTASAPARTRLMTLSIFLVAMRGRWRRLRRGSPLGSSHAFLTVGGVLLARPAKIGTSSSESSTPGLFAVPKNKTNVSEMVQGEQIQNIWSRGQGHGATSVHRAFSYGYRGR